MTGPIAWWGLPQARRAALAGVLCVAAAYQFRRPIEIDLASPLLTLAGAQGIGAPEENYAWTGDRARLVFPEPGSGLRVRVDLEIGGWRPRGQAPPI